MDGDDDKVPTLYASTSANSEIAISAKSGIEKLVRSASDADASSAFSSTATVNYGDSYTYQITVSNTKNTQDDKSGSAITKIIILDKLEDGVNQRYETEHNNTSSVFYGLNEEPNSWKGTIKGINLSGIDTNEDINIYYHTDPKVGMPDYLTENGTLSFVKNGDTYNLTYNLKESSTEISSGWKRLGTYAKNDYVSFEEVTDPVYAIAADLGGYELVSGNYATMDIDMTAPSQQTPGTQCAYNNPAYYSVLNGTDTAQAENGNAVKVKIGSTDRLVVAKEFDGNTLNKISDYPSLSETKFTFTITDTDGKEYANKRYRLWEYSGDTTPSGTAGTDYISLNGKYYTAVNKGEYMTTDAKGRLTLLANQAATLDVIGVQDYKVVESLGDNWQLNNIKESQTESTTENIVEPTTEIETNGEKTISVYNYTFKNVYKCIVNVKKTVTGMPDDVEDAEKTSFTYMAQKKNADGSYTALADCVYKHGSETDKTKANGEFTFAANETALLYLPDMLGDNIRISEVLSEEDKKDWKCTQSDGVSLTLAEGVNKAEFENVYQHKYLDIAKNLTHQMSDECTQSFSFEIYKVTEGGEEEKVTSFSKIYLIDADGEKKDLILSPDDENKVTNGVITAKCAGKTLRVEYLDANASYIVKEVYVPSDYAPVNDTVSKTMPNKAAGTSVSITNDYLWRNLSVTKQIVAKDPVTDTSLSFELYLYKKDGTPVQNAEYTGSYDNEGKKTGTNGEFTIHNGETVTFDKLDKTGTVYQIAEKVDGTYLPLSLSYSSTKEGTITNPDSFTLGSDGKTTYAYTVTNGSDGFLALNKSYDMPADTSDEIKNYLKTNTVNFKFTVTNGTLSNDWQNAVNGIDNKENITKSGNTLTIPIAMGSNAIINTSSIAKLDKGEAVLKYTLTEEIPDAVKSFYAGGAGCSVTNLSGSTVSGTANDRIVTVTNKLETLKGVSVYKYEYGASMSGQLVFKLQNADGTPVPNVSYMAVMPSGKTLTDICQTDANGYASVNVSGTNSFKLIFGTDKKIVINPADAVPAEGYRLTELVSQSKGCGYLVGFDTLSSYTGDTLSDQFDAMTKAYKTIDEIPCNKGADVFVNTKSTQQVQLAKAAIDGDTTRFTFRLKQVWGDNEYTANGITYSVYTIDGDTLVSNGNMVDDNGELTLEAGQYAVLTLPKYTKWRAYEKTSAGYNLIDIEASGFNTSVKSNVSESTSESTTEAVTDEDLNNASIVKYAKADTDAYGRYVYNNSSSYAEWSNDKPEKMIYYAKYPAVLVRSGDNNYKFCFCKDDKGTSYEEYYGDKTPSGGNTATESQYVVKNDVEAINGWDNLTSDYFVNKTKFTVNIPNTISAQVKYSDLDENSQARFREMNGNMSESEAEKSDATVTVTIPVVAINNGTRNGSDGVFCQKITSSMGKYTLDLSNNNNLKYIGEGAFDSCTGLDKIIISDSVEVIGGRAFAYIANNLISEINLGKGVKYLDYKAFYQCSGDCTSGSVIGCSDFSMGPQVEKVGRGAFTGVFYTDSFEFTNIKYYGNNLSGDEVFRVWGKKDGIVKNITFESKDSVEFGPESLRLIDWKNDSNYVDTLKLKIKGDLGKNSFFKAFARTKINNIYIDLSEVTSIRVCQA